MDIDLADGTESTQRWKPIYTQIDYDRYFRNPKHLVHVPIITN